jgi:hypothetical protein
MAHKKETKEKWSSEVTERSDALDLEEGVLPGAIPKKLLNL